MLQVRLRLHSRNLADFLGRIRDEMKMEQKSHYMYVLECADGSLYTGYAVDVQARLAAHNMMPCMRNTSSSSFPATRRMSCSHLPPIQISKRP